MVDDENHSKRDEWRRVGRPRHDIGRTPGFITLDRWVIRFWLHKHHGGGDRWAQHRSENPPCWTGLWGVDKTDGTAWDPCNDPKNFR